MARLGLVLTLGLSLDACALPWPLDDGPATGNPDSAGNFAAWVDYLGGDDLRNQCADGELDRFRLVYQEAAQLDIHILDVATNGAGGAQLRHHRLEPADLASDSPSGPWRDRGERLELSPGAMSGLMGGLDRMGVFSPSLAGPAAAAPDLSWLISGCLNGAWFLNLYQPPPETEGVNVNAPTPFAGPFAGPFTDRTRVSPPRRTGGRSGSDRPAPAGTPMASLAAPATDR